MVCRILLALLAVVTAATIGGCGEERVEVSDEQEATKETGSREGGLQRELRQHQPMATVEGTSKP
jgi:hypothetical protein